MPKPKSVVEYEKAVNSILDKLQKFRVKLTQKNIDDGVPRRPSKCAVVLSAKDSLKKAFAGEDTRFNRFSARVDAQKIMVSFVDSELHQRHVLTYLTPPAAQDIVYINDGHADLLPKDRRIATPRTFVLKNPIVAKPKPTSWQDQRGLGASRIGKKYKKSGRKRKDWVPKERTLGFCLT